VEPGHRVARKKIPDKLRSCFGILPKNPAHGLIHEELPRSQGLPQDLFQQCLVQIRFILQLKEDGDGVKDLTISIAFGGALLVVLPALLLGGYYFLR